MKAAAGEGYATATDLADWLVRTLKMPFRDAHHVTGRIVGLALEAGRGAARTAAQGDAGGRAEDHGRGLARAVGGGLGQEPDQLWRHRAEERASQAKAWLKRLEKEQK